VADDLCVNCRRRPIDPLWRPFCSDRCRLLDLGRWLDGDYRIAGPARPNPDDDGADDPPDERST
jgi:endogenous inhibitor of DNA gyrase (YacG/DUF329 family)